MTILFRRFFLAPVFIAGLVLASLTIGATSASAHDSLVSSAPAADSNVSAGFTTVVLTFTEQPNAEFPDSIAIHVADAAGSRIDTGAVIVGDRTLTVGVAPTVNGMYRVIWQSLSVDGHAISGQFDFSYTGAPAQPTVPSGVPSAATTGAPPAAGAAAPSSSATDSPLGADAGDSVTSANGSLALGLGIGILVLIVAAAVVLLLTRRTRSKAAEH